MFVWIHCPSWVGIIDTVTCGSIDKRHIFIRVHILTVPVSVIEACQFLSNFFPFFETASVSCLHVQVEPQAQVSPATKRFGVAESEKRANGKRRIVAAYRLLWLLWHSFSSGFLEILEAQEEQQTENC